MSLALRCNRCGGVSENDEDYKRFKRLDYYGRGTGHYYTIHLCESCHKLFENLFMKMKQWVES